MRSKRATSALAEAKTTQVRSKTKRQSGSPHNGLAQAFLKRSVKMLERVSSSASSEALESALSAPTDIGGVATLLSDLAPLAARGATPEISAMATPDAAPATSLARAD